MPADSEFYGKILTDYGALGVLALFLVLAVRTLWVRLNNVAAKLDAVQAARVAERDAIVRALTETTVVMRDVVEALQSRRQR